VACMGGKGEVHTWFWWGNLTERDLFQFPGLDGRIILKWIFKMWDGGAWTGFIYLRIGTDICQMKNKNWIACVQDRGIWKEVVEKAKTFNY